MTATDHHHPTALAELEADPDAALDLAAARLAIDVTALLDQAFEASGLEPPDLAERLGVSEERVCQVLHGDGNIRIATMGRFLGALGYRANLTARPLAGGPEITARPLRPTAADRPVHTDPPTVIQGDADDRTAS